MSSQPITIKEKIRIVFKGIVFKGKEAQVFKPHEIIDMVLQKYPDTNKSSILAADRCYNIVNKGIEKHFDFHVFKALEDGSYLFLGERFPYTGHIRWKGKIVGEWVNGRKTYVNPLK
jgi:hypothetical protein